MSGDTLEDHRVSLGGQVVAQGRNSVQIGGKWGSLKSRFGALVIVVCVFLVTMIFGCILLSPRKQNVMILGMSDINDMW